MGKKVVSNKGKKWFAAYRGSNRFAKNKRNKLERHLKLYPNDEVAKKCLESGIFQGFDWKRKTPNTPEWNHTDKYFAQVWKSLGHSGTSFLDHLKKLKRGPQKTVTKALNV